MTASTSVVQEKFACFSQKIVLQTNTGSLVVTPLRASSKNELRNSAKSPCDLGVRGGKALFNQQIEDCFCLKKLALATV